ncbi:MAG: cyclic pyranopterin monophosphate synthase MoaC, partial [Thermoplasmata archaeon]
LPITHASIEFFIEGNDVVSRCKVKANYKTGVEIEALHGVTIALLTIWDMVKYMEKDEKGQYPSTIIHDIRVIEKKVNKWE